MYRNMKLKKQLDSGKKYTRIHVARIRKISKKPEEIFRLGVRK